MGQRNRIGETLRSAREKTGLSVEQAAADAGIPAQYVRLLEGESDVRIGIADELYLIPFFRRYTAFLNLDTTDLLPEFVSMVQDMAGEGSPPLELAYRSSWKRVWRPVALLGAVAAAAAVVLMRNPEGAPPRDVAGDAPAPTAAIVEQVVAAAAPAVTIEPTPMGAATPVTPAAVETTGPTKTPFVVAAAATTGARPAAKSVPTASPPSTQPTSAPDASSSPPAAGAPAAPTAALAAPEATPAAAIPAGPVRELRIDASEDTWVQVAVDGSRSSLVLKAGQSRTWTGTTSFALTIGNAAGVTVSLDGQAMPALGRQGQVVRVKLPREAEPAR